MAASWVTVSILQSAMHFKVSQSASFNLNDIAHLLQLPQVPSPQPLNIAEKQRPQFQVQRRHWKETA
jgi:hypothetical protein